MIQKLYPKNNSPELLERLVSLLNDGAVMIVPTDTQYALACHALKERAIERICRLKGLDPRKNHLSVVCYDMSSISEYAKVDNATFKLMKRNLPGPFTFILPGTTRLPKIFSGRREVGIRMPDCPMLHELLAQLQAPMMIASLPLDEGEEVEYLTEPELIHEKWEERVDLVIDGGTGGTEGSTVVDCTQGGAEILRQGIGWLEE
ncbi:MAG: L-threonylcarbamoyladenylate synthase [Bacteroides sp.]